MINVPESLTLRADQVKTDEEIFPFKAEELPAALSLAAISPIREIRMFFRDENGKTVFISLSREPDTDPREWRLTGNSMLVAGEVTLPPHQG